MTSGLVFLEDGPMEDQGFVSVWTARQACAGSAAGRAQWLLAQGAKRFVFRSNSYFALREAAEQGQGIIVLGVGLVTQDSELVRLETEAWLPSVPVYLAYHRELRGVKRVRLVLDALEAALRASAA